MVEEFDLLFARTFPDLDLVIHDKSQVEEHVNSASEATTTTTSASGATITFASTSTSLESPRPSLITTAHTGAGDSPSMEWTWSRVIADIPAARMAAKKALTDPEENKKWIKWY